MRRPAIPRPCLKTESSPTTQHFVEDLPAPAAVRRFGISQLPPPQSQPGSNGIKGFLDRYSLPCFHVRKPLSDGITILPGAECSHGLSVRFALDNEIDTRRHGVHNFKLQFSACVQSGSQFL
ncbi:MAG: hypothetical protein RLZZ436_337 [Planctomycetota bacterium]